MIKFLKTWWPSIITVLIVIYATLWPKPLGNQSLMIFPHADKIIHCIMMGGIVSAVLFDWKRAGHKLSKRFIYEVGLSVLFFSVVDEFAQKFMALGRSCDIEDLLANIIGIIGAMLVAPSVINTIFQKKE